MSLSLKQSYASNSNISIEMQYGMYEGILLLKAMNEFDCQIGEAVVKHEFNFKSLSNFVEADLTPLAEHIKDSSYIVIDLIEVEYDFQSMGIGSILMNEVELYAKDNESEYILLQVFPVHTEELEQLYRLELQSDLKEFYSNRGFETLTYRAGVDGELDFIIMYKEVNQ